MSHWITHKFGGTSLADAAGYRRVAALVSSVAGPRQAVVVSAPGGVTDALVDLIEQAGRRSSDWQERLEAIRSRILALAQDLASDADDLTRRIESDLSDIRDVLRASSVMGAATRTATDLVSGYGEVWSANLLAAALGSEGLSADVLDARQVLVVTHQALIPVVDSRETTTRLDEWIGDHDAPVAVITGFIATDRSGSPTTLGRNGSDYSAAIFSSLLEASELTIWTDVDGVLSADPRLVAQSHVIPELSYEEAMELAYFGAKVIHPATLTPVIETQIPVTIRNTFHPDRAGTRIVPGSSTEPPVKGFASIDAMALINVEGTALVGVPGISERLFGALRQAGVSVVMISQGSSEHSICFVVPEDEAQRASDSVIEAFASERTHGQVRTPEITKGCTVLAAVGDGMSGTPGIAARFFGSLARAGVNIRAIAQGASERNISVVIESAQATRALRAAHAGFYLSRRTLSLGVIGPGHVGAALLDQIDRRREWLVDRYGIDLRVRMIASSTRLAYDPNSIDLAEWRDLMGVGPPRELDLDEIADLVHDESVPHAAVVDCTASDEVAAMYQAWLGRGIHVVTPNKRANSGDIDYYRALQAMAGRADAHYFYETTVGAALPVIQTLRDLVTTGDEVRRIEGILSGTLSYLFNEFDGSKPFSYIVAEARASGYTEPDPREDLSGTDVARKVVILAREMGMEVSLEDVSLEGLVPPELTGGSVDDFMSRLVEHDDVMVSMVQDAKANGEVVRFVGVIDPADGCHVSLRHYRSDHPFARISHTDNVVAFHTTRYSENPLVVQGPGAGPEVTAGGVFADLLRLANYLGG